MAAVLYIVVFITAAHPQHDFIIDYSNIYQTRKKTMTFCAQAKTEITENSNRNGCCNAAHLYGMLLFAKIFSAARISVSSEHEFVVRHAESALNEFGIKSDMIISAKTTRGNSIQIIDKTTLDRIFFDFGYTGEEASIRIIKQNFLCDDCLAAFIAGCFLTGGNITAPDKGYHLEFSTHKFNLFSDLAEILTEAGFELRKTTRGYAKVLYFKNSTQIEDMLTYMGAVQASLELMNTKIYKDIVNTVNRRTNCENANIDKIINSASRDRKAIEYIFKTKGEVHLPDSLRDIARLRLDCPELSLSELGEMLDVPLTKSGVSHKLRRIRDEAERLKNETEGQ